MNQVATKSEGGLSYKNVSIAQTGGGGMLLPQTFGEVVAFATMMSRSQHAIPKHLRENDGACMAVTMQALRWEMDPFMVASKSYNVKDLIAYEAQLVAAVVNTRAPIAKRPVYRYEGTGDTRKCIVSCEMLDGSVKEYESPEVGKITTKNSPLWKADPDQQLGYFSIRSWARRHTPEVILGVYTPDEAEQFHGPDNARDITPQTSVMQRLRAAQDTTQEPQGGREGFNPDHVTRETSDALTGEILDKEDTGAQSSPTSAAPVDDAGSAPASEDTGSDAASEEPVSSSIPEDELPKLRSYAKDLFVRAAKPETDAAIMKAIEGRWASDIENMSTEGKLAARSISLSMRSIMKGDVDFQTAVEFHAEGLRCEPVDLGGEANG